MSPQAWTAVFAGLALLGQVTNLILFLKIQVAQLQTEQKIMEKADCKFAAEEVCKVQMEDHERRITGLEQRCA